MSQALNKDNSRKIKHKKTKDKKSQSRKSQRIGHNWFWRRRWHPTPVLLPGKSHGQRSLVGCSPWGREESDMTSLSLFTFMHWSYTGEMGELRKS